MNINKQNTDTRNLTNMQCNPTSKCTGPTLELLGPTRCSSLNARQVGKDYVHNNVQQLYTVLANQVARHQTIECDTPFNYIKYNAV